MSTPAGAATVPADEPAAAPTGPVEGGVWDDLVGQEPAVRVLRQAAAADRVGHAWLITGPPGSGRSNAARAFAAALQCPRGGCGACTACRTALQGTHPDVTLVRTDQLSLRVDEIRELVGRAARAPVGDRRWQVLVVEDTDRLTEQAADALLKSLEEPAERTIWLLCAPTVEDVVPTIRSRCRLLVLRTPPAAAVAAMLQRRLGVDPRVAMFAARASQGHIGRARALAADERVRARHREVLAVPSRLGSLAACLDVAAELVAAANEEAKQFTAEADPRERQALEQALGGGTRGVRSRHAQAALRELEEQQRVRAKRLQRDGLDRALLDLISFYRDVLALGLGTAAELVNEEIRADVERVARQLSPEQALRAVDAIRACREAIDANVAPQLAVESLLVQLRSG